MLYAYGLKLGVNLLVRGKMRHALPYLIRPVNYWRTIEYQCVCNEANFQSGDRVLDIGSPKLLSVYLADKVGAEVTATDIESYFIEKLTLLRHLKGISPDRLRIKVEDGRKLSFDDAHYDKVYAISVLEHIPDDGDTECVAEISRVLRIGGRCVITVPFSHTSRAEYTDDAFYWAGSSTRHGDGKAFYQRRYSESDLYNRIIKPSGMSLKRLSFIGERVMTKSDHEFSDSLPALTGPIQPVLSKLFHTGPVDSWKVLKKPLCAVVVLEKQSFQTGETAAS